mmetsp:Transcript_11478/g.29158  ORF Transcript_11478/g.29158 Transcript_11478/m.29158 type:complete len:203 (+) Transcript_11478:320-928(+)
MHHRQHWHHHHLWRCRVPWRRGPVRVQVGHGLVRARPGQVRGGDRGCQPRREDVRVHVHGRQGARLPIRHREDPTRVRRVPRRREEASGGRNLACQQGYKPLRTGCDGLWPPVCRREEVPSAAREQVPTLRSRSIVRSKRFRRRGRRRRGCVFPVRFFLFVDAERGLRRERTLPALRDAAGREGGPPADPRDRPRPRHGRAH